MPQSVLTAEVRHTPPDQVLAILKLLPYYLQQQGANTKGLAGVFNAHVSRSLFESIHKAFLVKAQGRTDELGTKWKPLAASTIRSRKNLEGTAKTLFSIVYARLRPRIGANRARGIAQTISHAATHSLGKKPRLLVFGGQHFLIGVVSGKLLRSYQPGRVYGTKYVPPHRDQVLKVSGDSFTIGSRVEYAVYFDAKRPIVPPSPEKQQLWVDRAVDQGVEGVCQHLRSILR